MYWSTHQATFSGFAWEFGYKEHWRDELKHQIWETNLKVKELSDDCRELQILVDHGTKWYLVYEKWIRTLEDLIW